MDFRMATVYLVLNWFFGVLFLLFGLISISEKLVSLCFFAIALLLIPPVRNFIYSKTNKSLSRDARVITVSILIIMSFALMIQNQEKEKSEQAQQKAKQEADRLAKRELDAPVLVRPWTTICLHQTLSFNLPLSSVFSSGLPNLIRS